MPIFTAKLSDGRTVRFESDEEPSTEDIISAADSYKPPRTPSGPGISAAPDEGLFSRFGRTDIAKNLGLESESARLTRTSQATEGADPFTAGGEGFVPAVSHPFVPLESLKANIGPNNSTVGNIGRALWNTGVGIAEFMESPLGVATAGIGAVAEIPASVLKEAHTVTDAVMAAKNIRTLGAAGKAAGLAYTGQMAAQLPEQATQLGTLSAQPGHGAEAAIRFGAAALMPFAAAHGASLAEGRATSFADRAEQRVGEDARLVKPTTEPTAAVPLTPEEHAYLSSERTGIEAPIEVVDNLHDETQPFADTGRVATIRPDGTIEVHGDRFKAWLADVPEKNREKATQSMVAEEANHAAVQRTIGAAGAEDFWNNLTSAEKSLHFRRYTGEWTPEALAKKYPGVQFSPAQLGYEALNSFQMRLARMTLREAAEAGTKEKWTVKTLDTVAHVLFKAREALGTAASGMQRALLDLMETNLDAMRGTMPKGSAPDAYRKDVKILKADGTEYDAEFNGYYDLRSLGAGATPSIGYRLPDGTFTHGTPHEGEKIVTDIPSVDEWKAMQKEGPAAYNKKAQEVADETVKGLRSQAQIYRDQGDAKSAAQLEEMAKTVERKMQEDSFPAAFNKRRKETSDQGVFFLPPMPKAQPLERGGFEEATPNKLMQAAAEHLADAPNFKKFAGELQSRFGAGVQKGQLRDVWEDAVWKHMLGASGEQLATMRRQLKLERNLGAREVADARQSSAPVLTAEMNREAAARQREGQRIENSRQNYRTSVVRAIAQKLIGQSYEGESLKKALGRATVSADDLAEGRPDFYREISADDAASPERLGKLVTENFRASSSLTESFTKRLVALVNKSTGETSLVSVYLHPRTGPMIVDPRGTTKIRPNVPLASVLKDFRPIATALLDEPVKNFRQKFEDVRHYQDQFAKDAQSKLTAQASYEASLGAESGVEGTTEDKPSVLGSQERISETEAGAMLDKIYDTVGKIESPADVARTVAELKDTAKRGKPDWNAIAAFQKAFDALRRVNPDVRLKDLYEDIHRKATAAKDRADFQRRVLESYSGREGDSGAVRPVEETSAAAPSPTGRELSMRERVAPTVDRSLPPAGFEMPQRQLKGPRQMPAAFRKQREAAEETIAGIKATMGAALTRRETTDKMAMTRDRADATANILGDNAGRNVSLASASEKQKHGNPEVLAAAIPLVHSGTIVTDYNLTPTEQQFLRLSLSHNPAWNLMSQTLRTGTTQARAFAALQMKSIREGVIRKLISTGKFPPRQLSYSVDPNAQRFIPLFRQKVESGIAKAQAQLGSRNLIDRREAKAWIKAGESLLKELDYANAHFNDPELVDTAMRAHQELDAQYQRSTDAGIDVRYDANYLPGRYDGEFFNDNAVTFGGRRILGRQYRAPKTFATYYDAIATGPYIPVTRDISSLVGHSVRQASRQLNKGLWVESLKGIIDPDSGKPAVTDPVRGSDGEWAPPDKEHELVFPNGRGKPIAVRLGMKSLVKNLTSRGAFEDSFPLRTALATTQILKHTILLGDFFHLARLSYYAGAIMGKHVLGSTRGFKGGATILEYRPEQVDEAVTRGVISAKDAAWGRETVNVTMNGKPVPMSRLEISKAAIQQGLNVGRIQDAIYKDLIKNIPGFGSYNRWLFDRFTRGLMLESAVRDFERLNASHPDIDARKLMRDVAKDTNNFFGSIGRQGWVKNPTTADLTRMFFLAPQWVEGLIKKELAVPSRLTGLSYATGRRGVPLMGTTGRGMARGLAAMFALTQVVNLISRRQPTWQNEEKDHKWDAYIPGRGESPGSWISPLSVFNELLHDLVRYGESKPNVMEAIDQIGRNKFGPGMRAAWVLGTGFTGSGERLTTSASRLKEAGMSLLPVPISFGKIAQEAGHQVAPGLIHPTAPGTVQRQAMGSLGIKSQIESSPGQRISRMAQDWLEKEGLKKETGHDLSPNDEASFGKLRDALRVNDTASAQRLLSRLMVGRKPDDIVNAMRIWKSRPFTGSEEHEHAFKFSLTDAELETYLKAELDRQQAYERFLDFFLSQ